MHYELPIVSFLCALLVLAPLPWHWRAGTIPTIAITFWLFVSNIISGVNSIVWAGNVVEVAPVWCDISTKLNIGCNVALPAALFRLSMHLERVSSMRQVQTSHRDKKIRQLLDAGLCFGVPIIYMALHYIVQGHRFDIVEDFGCRPHIYVSIPSTFIIWVPPLTFSLVAAGYSTAAFRHFWIRRITFARHLQSSQSALTASHYFRLMSMAFVQIFWGVFIIVFDMWFTMKGGLRPWISWEDVHYDFLRVGQFPTVLIPQQFIACTFILWWTIPVSSILFFGFFSFGQEAMKEYRKCGAWVKYSLLRRPQSAKKTKTSMLPSYVAHGPTKPRSDSMTKPPPSPHSTATLAESEYQHKDVDLEVYDIRRDSDVHDTFTPSSPTETTIHGDADSIVSMYVTKHYSVQ